ncbi:MFS transporter [Paenibacillaceae bacterium WGS1546]|uniref:MFS transporter n=1 Tax=Cohnella sp. WGS1546 TaxID=3366810 RepID=UPI00372D86CA
MKDPNGEDRGVRKLWTRSFIQLNLVMMLLCVAFYLLLPALPLYIRSLGGSEAQIGLIIGLFTISSMLVRPLIGGLMIKYGRRPFMLGGLLLFLLSLIGYEFAVGLLGLLLLRILHGMSWATSTAAIGATVADIVPPHRRAEGVGWFGTAPTLAMAIGPWISVWVMDARSFRHLFWYAALLLLAALALAYITRVPYALQSAHSGIVFFETKAAPILAIVFFNALALGGLLSFWPLFAEEIAVSSDLFFLAYACALLLSRPLTGQLADRYGETRIVLPGLLCAAAGLLVLSFADQPGLIIVAAVLFGLGFGSSQPALQAAVLRLSHPDRKSVANASFFTCFDLGNGLGAILFGALSRYLSYSQLFLLGAASLLISWCVFLASRSLLRSRLDEARAVRRPE